MSWFNLLWGGGFGFHFGLFVYFFVLLMFWVFWFGFVCVFGEGDVGFLFGWFFFFLVVPENTQEVIQQLVIILLLVK